MKRIVLLLLFAMSGRAFGQVQDIEQLQLDLEKLVQMKAMLSNMYNGYATLVNGYNNITAQAKGNFDLHKNYLDALLQVNAQVRNNPAVQNIADMQSLLSNESQTAYLSYLKSGLFSAAELVSVKTQLDQLKIKVSQRVTQLSAVLAAGVLRMSDQERITAIERIDKDVGEALAAERALVKEQNRVLAERVIRKKEIDVMRFLYGIKN